MQEDDNPEQALLDKSKERIAFLKDKCKLRDRELLQGLVDLVEAKNKIIQNLTTDTDTKLLLQDLD